ncbi:MAG: hypothetical protein IPF78_17660 [Flavobacteriales bacterium]|nr:hypothetical protein [Flavobacteriales bacterium]
MSVVLRPRARRNRGIFVINELPDLQPRIQVALFNILQEGDVQVRGFKMRLPLDIQFVFTANPDYFNRGAIITPLKDHVRWSLTHYPASFELGMKIAAQEMRSSEEQRATVDVPDLMRVLVERIAMEARDSEFVDRKKSGVSAHASAPGALESVVSAAERRALYNNNPSTPWCASVTFSVVPAITGKIELVYEGEQEG